MQRNIWVKEEKKMKKIFETPVVEIIAFYCEDIVTTSGETYFENELPIVGFGIDSDF